MEEKRKVLIITYYWPPSGGAGVQRWLNFTKYLPDYAWEPIVFTPENPQFDLKDHSLKSAVDPRVDVLKFPIWEPYNLFKRISGTKELKQGQILEEKSNNWIKQFSIFLRGNLFIPDPRRFWVKPASQYLKEIIESNEIKHVITTGPPHSLHLIGLNLKYHNPSITWLADFRDPWTEWDIMKQFRMLPFVRKKHERMEKEVLKVADATMATGEEAANDLNRLGARKTAVFTNGYDHEKLPFQELTTSKYLRILHLGMLSEGRLPLFFFKALNDTLGPDELALKIQFTGIVSPVVIGAIDELTELKKVVGIKDSVPFDELKFEYQNSDILLLLQTSKQESKVQLPGKLFEYLSQKRPILAFGDPQSDVAKILDETNSGIMIAYDDLQSIETVVEELRQGVFGKAFTYQHIEQFSREEIAKQLAAFLNTF